MGGWKHQALSGRKGETTLALRLLIVRLFEYSESTLGDN